MAQQQNWLVRVVSVGLGGIGTVALIGFAIAVQAQEIPSQGAEPATASQTTTSSEINSQVLQVGIGGTPPFLMRQGDNAEGSFYGIVPDVWEQIALLNNFKYEYVLQTRTQDALDAVASGELDILVGPFSITAKRLETVDFTQPFFVSEIGVVLPQQSPTIWSRVKPFFTRAALSSVGALVVCLFLVGNAMWLAERKANPEQFPKDYLHGVGNGMWFSLVTLTTVGYGDRAPATPAGRVIASTWMLISLIAVSSLIGGLASAFTLALSQVQGQGIVSPADLRGAPMAVVSGTTGEKWAAEYRARLLKQSNLKEAITMVVDGEADGAVFDRPALEYYLSQNPDLDLRLADFTLNSENFGFVLPQGSPLTITIDQTIVRLDEEGTIGNISQNWIQGIGSMEGKAATQN
jgi:polar amino acid transport system substrate-binding protein